jgi:hypothetical protein
MLPLISITCLLVGTFIVLTRTLLFCVGMVIAKHHVQHPDEL